MSTFCYWFPFLWWYGTLFCFVSKQGGVRMWEVGILPYFHWSIVCYATYFSPEQGVWSSAWTVSQSLTHSLTHSVSHLDWLLISVTTPRSEHSLAGRSHFHLAHCPFWTWQPVFSSTDKSTARLWEDEVCVFGVCVCLCVSGTLWKHSREKEGKKKRLLGERGQYLNLIQPSSSSCFFLPQSWLRVYWDSRKGSCRRNSWSIATRSDSQRWVGVCPVSGPRSCLAAEGDL